jgi:hypothetical protein
VTGVLMWWNGRAARTAEAKRGTVVAKRERVA